MGIYIYIYIQNNRFTLYNLHTICEDIVEKTDDIFLSVYII